MRDEEQGGHRWERVRGKHSRRCAPATGGVPMPKMRCIDRKVRAESRSSEQTNLGSSTCHGLPCGFAVITNRNPHSRRTGGILYSYGVITRGGPQQGVIGVSSGGGSGGADKPDIRPPEGVYRGV